MKSLTFSNNLYTDVCLMKRKFRDSLNATVAARSSNQSINYNLSNRDNFLKENRRIKNLAEASTSLPF